MKFCLTVVDYYVYIYFLHRIFFIGELEIDEFNV